MACAMTERFARQQALIVRAAENIRQFGEKVGAPLDEYLAAYTVFKAEAEAIRAEMEALAA